MDDKGETFGCILGIIGAILFVVGTIICIVSLFLCNELDYSEEQQAACGLKSGFGLIFGLFMIIGSIAVMMISWKSLGLSTVSKNKHQQ